MRKDGLYIQLISIHGLIRSTSLELGRDADTGGQTKYVVELAKALARHEDIGQVDLVTRLIVDKRVSDDYGVQIEEISDNARIVRIQCGGRKYQRKELLWPHMEEFIDKSIKFITSEEQVPDVFHGHYADAGYVAMQLAAAFDAPFFFTGHSMGRNKLAKLVGDGMKKSEINRQYKIDTRIDMEERIIAKADMIITSTQQEIDKQYGLYENGPKAEYAVIPPGIDLDTFYPYYDSQFDADLLTEESKQVKLTLKNELYRFWTHPEKPFILALCRSDHRKNITGLIEAYGTNKELQALANLAIFAGIRQDINGMEENEKGVLTDMLLQMDRHDLYGKLAIPKKHDFSTEVPALYRMCAQSHGVFVNPALVEPFGLTLIEASACGLPIVATNDGGPVDIVRNCANGILVDARSTEAIAEAIRKILIDPELWDTFSNNGINGVRSHYSWNAHCQRTVSHYCRSLPDCRQNGQKKPGSNRRQDRPSFGKRLTGIKKLLITDIDNTLIGDNESLAQLLDLLDEHRREMAWGVATGRSLELTLEAMTEFNIPIPDVLICSVGTELYYGPDLRMDKGWQQHISNQWKPEKIKECLTEFPWLVFQEAEGQRSHKISYYLENIDNRLEKIQKSLDEHRLRCQVIYSHGQFLDILPHRASKGKAVNYIQYKYDFLPRHVMVAGDSGNDTDMLSGRARGLIVGNHSEELEHLKGSPRTYFAKGHCAAGIIEGLHNFGLI
ncbi:sucrose-phosphate phosphatase [Desulfopila aestuarii]|uniref:Sucrose-phosphate synthase n=1 Tax=Desulfopila aestuarii DSM 18488 TaxID=1121416 RepID=A0A1M7YE91_9BACT|nr:sucrose-phosphate phosphatase [Desulfopila aestuarii]SHO50911.1 sucrose-phosphate synthase [Desulfopila aestuarii DSM 18488]